MGILVVFVLSTIGAKLILGLAAIYYLMPSDGRCSACDGDTLPLVGSLPGDLLGRVLRVQKRWCVRCGRTHFARRSRERRIFVGRSEKRTPAVKEGAP